MGPLDLVELTPAVRRHFVPLPRLARPGTVWQLEDGSLVRIRADGGADELVQSGHPRRGIAADPYAARRAP